MASWVKGSIENHLLNTIDILRKVGQGVRVLYALKAYLIRIDTDMVVVLIWHCRRTRNRDGASENGIVETLVWMTFRVLDNIAVFCQDKVGISLVRRAGQNRDINVNFSRRTVPILRIHIPYSHVGTNFDLATPRNVQTDMVLVMADILRTAWVPDIPLGADIPNEEVVDVVVLVGLVVLRERPAILAIRDLFAMCKGSINTFRVLQDEIGDEGRKRTIRLFRVVPLGIVYIRHGRRGVS